MIEFWEVRLIAIFFTFTASYSLLSGGECAGCHQEIAGTYAKTGMGRSFSRPSPANTIEDYTGNATYYHKASDSYFTMLWRDGKYYQRRYQLDGAGKQINVMEKQIDFIMGSGNHSRTYLHKTEQNHLIELPLAWYAEKGGYWAMNPGYDRPDHEGFRREIGYDCMFCHNAYPEIPAGNDGYYAEPIYAGAMPEGIDCERCHGPGGKHMELAKRAGVSRDEVRKAIVNPARLSEERQAEVCMQCHLETTSFPLPNSIRRFERGPFSYRPGEPLAEFILNFDQAPGKGRDEKFEIVNAEYRMRKSECFLQSKGKLRCTTCHNPHDIPRGEAAAKHYTAVCRQCHAGAFERLVASGKHTAAEDCTDCHMPKRRTEDVVHVVMTDHYIQRRKPAGDLLAEMAERHETEATAYRGEVVPYYPNPLAKTPENEVYRALAQVIQKSNLKAGVGELAAAIEKARPERAEYDLELAEAWRESGQMGKALAAYEEAVRRDPKFVYGLRELGVAFRRSGRAAEAVEYLKRAAALKPESANTWRELGLAYQADGKRADAIGALERATGLNPDLSEAFNNLGVIRYAGGEQGLAEAAFREAIRIQPEYPDAHSNLGNLLSGSGDLTGARLHFEIALRLRPADAPTHYNYAMVLGRTRRFDEAERELEEAVRVDPGFADAQLVLGDMSMAKGDTRGAVARYREAARIQPQWGRAQLGLGSALLATGDVAGALPHLRRAAADVDAGVREEAERVLREVGK